MKCHTSVLPFVTMAELLTNLSYITRSECVTEAKSFCFLEKYGVLIGVRNGSVVFTTTEKVETNPASAFSDSLTECKVVGNAIIDVAISPSSSNICYVAESEYVLGKMEDVFNSQVLFSNEHDCLDFTCCRLLMVHAFLELGCLDIVGFLYQTVQIFF